jgi:hypothetical protein
MHQSAIVLRPTSGWAQTLLKELSPGAHIAVEGAIQDSLEGRRVGFVLRDCLTVLDGNRTRSFFLFRAPLDGDTVAANVLKHGTGGINVAACHVGDDLRMNQPCGSPDNAYSGGWNTNPTPTLAQGRWPTNLVFVHSEACSIQGKVKIKVSATSVEPGQEIRGKFKQTYDLGWAVRSTTQHGQNGAEFVDLWRCPPDCALTVLHNQVDDLVCRFYPQLKGEAGLLEWITNLIALPGTTPLMVR